MKRSSLAALAIAVAAACSSEGEPVRLGPVDGLDLSPADTGRVMVGDMAPDFSLGSLSDGVVTLSALQGHKDVVLVFYRGHW